MATGGGNEGAEAEETTNGTEEVADKVDAANTSAAGESHG